MAAPAKQIVVQPEPVITGEGVRGVVPLGQVISPTPPTPEPAPPKRSPAHYLWAVLIAGALIDNTGQVAGGFNGTSVVQTHMTNSRLTDPEIFEFRFPVRLESYAIRQSAFGMAGGQSGQPGINRVVRSDGMVEEMGHIGQAEMQAGDVFEIHTPGAGGFGVP